MRVCHARREQVASVSVGGSPLSAPGTHFLAKFYMYAVGKTPLEGLFRLTARESLALLLQCVTLHLSTSSH